MLLGSYEKQPTETRRVLIRYSAWLGDGEQLDAGNPGVVVIARRDGLPLVADLDLTADGPRLMNNNTAVAVFVWLGIDGVDYKLSVVANTDQGQSREDEVLVRVREI
jgi:hypothetical protein